MRSIQDLRGRCSRRFIASFCCWWLLAICASSAQTSPSERSFHASKAEVQKMLHEIPLYAGGKLPVLEGFADGDGHSLDNYKRGFYQYDVELKSVSSTETAVRVNAKITAWYVGSSAVNSGYRLLKSSGRLESDLLDALNDKLHPNSVQSSGLSSKVATGSPLPDSPSASASIFNTQRLTTAPSDAKSAVSKVAGPPPTKRALALMQQAQNLQQILHNQTRPADLAVVKRSNTPVVAQPLGGGGSAISGGRRRRVPGNRCDGRLGPYPDLGHFSRLDTPGSC